MRRSARLAAFGIVLIAAAACGGNGDAAPEPDTSAAADPEGDESEAADPPAEPADPIQVGAIFDITGATGELGGPYAVGARHYFDHINASGGVEGVPIELSWQDYQYNVAIAEQLYSEYTSKGVVAILGWGTADTEALKGQIAVDEIPYFSGSLSEELSDPEEAPYNFIVGTTYSDQMRAALQLIHDEAGDDAEVAVFHHDSPFGESPVGDGEAYISEQGWDIGYQNYAMPGGATDFVSLLSQARSQGATHIVIQNIAGPAALLTRNVRDAGMDVGITVLNWGTNELFVELAGDAAEGVVGVSPWAPISAGASGAEEPAAYAEANGGEGDLGAAYLQGWYYAKLLTDAMAEVIRSGSDVTGAAIRQALEDMDPFDTGGVSPALDFSSDSHKGATATPVYRVEGGEWAHASDPIEP